MIGCLVQENSPWYCMNYLLYFMLAAVMLSSECKTKNSDLKKSQAIKVLTREINEKTAIIDIEGLFPYFENGAVELNEAIKNHIQELLDTYRALALSSHEAYQNCVKYWQANPYAYSCAFEHDKIYSPATWTISYTIEQLNDHYISIVLKEDDNAWGCRGQFFGTKTFNYDLKKNRMLAISDLFQGIPDWYEKMSNACLKKVHQMRALGQIILIVRIKNVMK